MLWELWLLKYVVLSLLSKRQHISYDCLEVKRDYHLSELFCAMLYMTILHSDTHMSSC